MPTSEMAIVAVVCYPSTLRIKRNKARVTFRGAWRGDETIPLNRRGMFPVNGTLLGRFSVHIEGTVKANRLVYN